MNVEHIGLILPKSKGSKIKMEISAALFNIFCIGFALKFQASVLLNDVDSSALQSKVIHRTSSILKI